MGTLIAVLALACGCTTIQVVGPDEQGFTWKKENATIPPEAWFVEIVPPGSAFLHCGLEPKAVACSVRRQTEGGDMECYVYVPSDAPKWVMAHEMRHCLGWVHGIQDRSAKR